MEGEEEVIKGWEGVREEGWVREVLNTVPPLVVLLQSP